MNHRIGQVLKRVMAPLRRRRRLGRHTSAYQANRAAMPLAVPVVVREVHTPNLRPPAASKPLDLGPLVPGYFIAHERAQGRRRLLIAVSGVALARRAVR